jgi:D-threo-aldose 1-dehydrogenase
MKNSENQLQWNQIKSQLPKVIFGTSTFGNLYEALPIEKKRAIVEAWFECSNDLVCIDSAGKYGAGLALEEIGDGLRFHQIPPSKILISNKLGWKRVPLTTDEPTFEPGVWIDLKHDAVQAISYEGMVECWNQGNSLLRDPFVPQLLSVHDPDEYLEGASSSRDRQNRFKDILGAYEALFELKDKGKALAIGIGAKNWHIIEEISAHVKLDWVMLANSLTVYAHPKEILQFVKKLVQQDIFVINSGIFHSGFLIGSEYFDYKIQHPTTNPELFAWRSQFFSVCKKYGVTPFNACVEFSLGQDGISSIALNTTKPERVKSNFDSVSSKAPSQFWTELQSRGIINQPPVEIVTC